jgi:hypothetical protein
LDKNYCRKKFQILSELWYIRYFFLNSNKDLQKPGEISSLPPSKQKLFIYIFLGGPTWLSWTNHHESGSPTRFLSRDAVPSYPQEMESGPSRLGAPVSRKDAPFLIPSIVAAAASLAAAPGTPQPVGAQRSQGATPGSPALLAPSPRTPQAQAGRVGARKGDLSLF